ncbi:MAG TPA: hypothetical protein VGR40_06445 [Candidatus Binatus sp.]|nr:hypothetical protein [Candidatus Binatus sp.]
MTLPRLDTVVLAMLGIVIGLLGLIVVYFVGLFFLMVVSFSCGGAKILNHLHLANRARVHCACDSGPKHGCFP